MGTKETGRGNGNRTKRHKREERTREREREGRERWWLRWRPMVWASMALVASMVWVTVLRRRELPTLENLAVLFDETDLGTWWIQKLETG